MLNRPEGLKITVRDGYFHKYKNWFGGQGKSV